jgi:succinate-semialdehyde dehydrogenase/glutarate-semialdehyde dehydrogenase
VRVGDPMKDDTEVGPLATKRIVEDLEAQVKTAKAAGARILTGGERMLGSGNYFETTVMVGVPRSCPVYREELFGPVAMLFRADDLSHAIQVANDTPFGLAASAWTREPSEQQRLVTELQCGSVFLNAMVASDPRLPFGGVKRSGYGRELSAAGMREFLNAKTVVIASPAGQQEHDDRLDLLPFADPRHSD